MSISKDTWNMFYQFEGATRTCELEGYKEEDAWPVLIDKFVSYMKKKWVIWVINVFIMCYNTVFGEIVKI